LEIIKGQFGAGEEALVHIGRAQIGDIGHEFGKVYFCALESVGENDAVI
jgi:hypothetical protein